MASLRLCAIFGAKNLIECLKRYCVAYPIALPSIKEAIFRFTDEKDVVLSSWESIRVERGRIMEFLRVNPILSKVYPSETNFICFSSRKSREIKEGLFQQGILVEDVSHTIPLSLRVTVGTRSENDLFLNAFSKISKHLANTN